jgi:sulfur carrier protein
VNGPVGGTEGAAQAEAEADHAAQAAQAAVDRAAQPAANSAGDIGARSEAPPICLLVNGCATAYPAGTLLSDVVSGLTKANAGIAVAVGEEIVPRGAWGARVLRDGEQVEILTAVQGG